MPPLLFLLLAVLPSCASAADPYAEIDRLYLRRDRPENLERSNGLLRERLREHPDDPGALWRLGRGTLRAGERLEGEEPRLRAFEEAEALAERSLAADPKDAEAHFWRGLAMGREGQVRGMIRSFFMVGPLKREMRRVLELDPEHAGAHHVLGEMYLQLPRLMGGSKKHALEELLAAHRLAPGRSSVHISLAETYLALGREEEARKILGELLELKTAQDPAELDGRREDARKMLERLGD